MWIISKALWVQITMLLTVVQAASGRITFTVNPLLPKMHDKVTISCYSTEDARTLYHNRQFITGCKKRLCMPKHNPQAGYNFTADDEKAEVTISSLDRVRDEGEWTCSAGGSGNITLDIYSFPRGMSITNGVETDGDLAKSQVTLQCETDGCTYPRPSIKWYYKNLTSPKRHTFSEVISSQQSRTEGDCTSRENIYTSTLTLPLYMTWSDNSDKTLTFSCGIEYTDPSRNVNSHESKEIRFAISVSKVQLQHNSQPVSDNSSLPVISGELVTMKCVPGTSRPDPIIEWYIGSNMRYSSTSQTYTFTPGNAMHDKVIYCRAYNSYPSKAVESTKPTLFVKAYVTEVRLQLNSQPVSDNSSLPVISGKPVTMNCVSGTSRPDPTIEWYIGLYMRNSSTSQNYTFTPSNEDHDKLIYCRVYNINHSRAVASNKSKLYVNVFVTSVNLSLSTPQDVFYEGYSKTLTCTSSPSRPIPTIRWFFDSRPLTAENINITHTKDDTGLYTRISQILLSLMRDDENRKIYCEGFVAKQQAVSSSRHTVNVWYAPDIIVDHSGSTLHNQTAVLICEARGVPGKNTFYPWIHTWQNDVIRMGLEGINNSTHSKLKLDSLSLENIGTYICSATNGVIGVNGKFEQTGSKYLNVTGVPNILYKKSIFAGEIGRSVNISIPFYSDSAIEIFNIKRKGTVIANTSNTSTYLCHEEIDYQMYNKTVHFEAQMAIFVIQNISKADFDNYTLVLKNDVGHIEFTFQLDSVVMEKGHKQDNATRDQVSVGIVAVVVVFAVIAGIIICQKRKSDRKKASDDQPRNTELRNRRRHDIVDCYENLPLRNDNGNPDNIYENVLGPERVGAAVHSDHTNVYENIPTQDRNPLRRKVSLVYADLKLENPKTNNGKPIIHGLENRTEYAEIAFGKQGVPLPDSDDE